MLSKIFRFGRSTLAWFGWALLASLPLSAQAATSPQPFEFKANDIMVMEGTHGKLAEWQAILGIDYFFVAVTTAEAVKLNEAAIDALVTERCTAICTGFHYQDCAGGYLEHLDTGLIQSLGNEPNQSQIVQQDASGTFQQVPVAFDSATGEALPGMSVFYKLQCAK